MPYSSASSESGVLDSTSAMPLPRICFILMHFSSILGPRPSGPFAFGNSRPKGRAPRADGARPRAAALRIPSNLMKSTSPSCNLPRYITR